MATSLGSGGGGGGAGGNGAGSPPSALARLPRPALEIRLKDGLKGADLFGDLEQSKAKSKSIQVEEAQESSCHHRQSFSTSSSTTSLKRATGSSSTFGDSLLRKTTTTSTTLLPAMSSSTSSSTSACKSESSSTLSRLSSKLHTNKNHDFATTSSASTSSSSSSSRHFRSSTSSSSVIVSQADKHAAFGLHPDSLFTSPDVRSLVREIGTDFAELENAVSTRSLSQSSSSSHVGANCPNSTAGPISTLSSRLFGRRLLSPIESDSGGSGSAGSNNTKTLSQSSSKTNLFDELSASPPASRREFSHRQLSELPSSGDKFRDLLVKTTTTELVTTTANGPASSKQQQQPAGSSKLLAITADGQAALAGKQGSLSVSIEKIDQKMSDLCKKLDDCNETKKAIELLKILIQMIEKAWSVPVCGDDLGFRLCNSLRVAGGLDTLLGFIQDADNLPQLVGGSSNGAAAADYEREPPEAEERKKPSAGNPSLRLNLSKVRRGSTLSSDIATPEALSSPPATGNSSNQAKWLAKDSDSDAITSDLGFDSASVESLSYVSAPAEPASDTPASINSPEELPAAREELAAAAELASENGAENLDAEEAGLRKEELVFLSAKLLSQCLTSDNRDYIVANGLTPVIKLACNFTTMKSSQSQQLLSRSMIMRQSSTTGRLATKEPGEGAPKLDNNSSKTRLREKFHRATGSGEQGGPNKSGHNKLSLGEPNSSQADNEHSVVHAIVGTEILQHLFKHSEDTCSKMISLGALKAVLYACRSSNAETLRHCASALANLALYGGPDIQQTMIERQAHHWLFPLAFNEDDNVQYYACLAIVVLAANQEIEADVQKSGTLDLVEPFVTLHEPQKFAESTTAHIHGQSASWLRKLVPLLESRRLEARSLACFHFAMEAYIKKEQGQTEVFKEIGAVNILKKVGSSPIAVISKFSCQALRLIGEKEPHRLSQHVPKWTCEDVVVWVSQIGFEKYREAFVASHVDGDLLLQLDEDMLRLDIGIDNGIIRRKFLRELSKLKQIADYSSVDKTNLSALLKSNAGSEFVQYIYMMIQLGVTSQNIHWLDIEQLLRQCKVSNAIHQLKLTHAIKNLQTKMAQEIAELNALDCLNSAGVFDANSDPKQSQREQKKTLDVFISYRRSTGSQLASLLKVHLQLRHFSVFIDVERLEAGKFDNNLLDSIKSAKNFILVLSPNALDRCIGDHECKDWVHKEIVAALASNCNIIPIMDSFHWPEADQLPEDMRSITYFNGVRWIHDYQDACVDKVERFIRGELINAYHNPYSAGGNPNSNSSAPSSLQRGAGTGGGTGSAGATGGPQNYASTPNVINSTPSTTATHSSRIPPPPFDSDHHPLSFASHYHQTHSHQPAAGTPTSGASCAASANNNNNNNATQPPFSLNLLNHGRRSQL